MTPSSIFARTLAFLKRHKWLAALKMWTVASLVGIVVGIAVIFFREAIMAGEGFFFGAKEERIVTAVVQMPAWKAVIAPVTGGAVVGLLLALGAKMGWGPRPRAFSVADVMKARRFPKQVKETAMSWRDAGLTAMISIVSLGAGSSTGREGPAVHLGAALAYKPAQWLGLDFRGIRTLLGCGAAAAVSASFNAPLAGVLFAREVVLQRYRTADIGPVAVASVGAALVSRAHFGDDALFGAALTVESRYLYFIATPLFGLLAAGLALIAINTWARAPLAGEELAERFGLPVWALPPLGGLILGGFALAFPQVLGVGYEPTTSVFAGGYGVLFMILLIFAKIAATSLCLGAHFGGGVFSPSMFIGAMLGGAFGIIVGTMTGDADAGRVFFTIVGMGAVAGAVLGAPMSTTLIAFELTASYESAAAVLISVSLATVLVQSQGGALFERQLKSKMRQNY